MRDTEESYRDWMLDVYQSYVDGAWVCDYWSRSDARRGGTVRDRKRAGAVNQAKKAIDDLERQSGRT
jgi:hypothetical protein